MSKCVCGRLLTFPGAASQAITEALDVARENHDEDCLSQALSWLTFIESKHNSGLKQKFSFGEDKAKNKNIAFLKSMDMLWDVKRKLQRVRCKA